MQGQLALQDQALKRAQEEIAGLKAELRTALREKQAAHANLQNVARELGQAKMILKMQHVTIYATRNKYGERSDKEIGLEGQLEVVTQELKQSTEQVTILNVDTSRTPPHSEAPLMSNTRPQEGTELPSIGESAVVAEWMQQKASSPCISEVMNIFMERFIGLETAKRFFLKTKAKIETMIRQGVDLRQEAFDLLVTGNPGTC